MATLLFQEEPTVAPSAGAIQGFKVAWKSGTSAYFVSVYRWKDAQGGVETFFQECPTLTDVTNYLTTFSIPVSTRLRNLLSNRG